MTAPASLLPNSRASVAKAFRLGTHRAVPPEETLARVRPFMSAMGITRIANITGLDRIGIPVVMVCRPNSRSLAVSQGKGLDLAAAKASALMESVEDYHAERIALPLKLGSYEDLRSSHRLVDASQLPRTTRSSFAPSLPGLWIEGYDLLQQEPVWVPYDLVHLRCTLPRLADHGWYGPSSNGLASGNHLLEAISHAICEVVERDATTLWWLRREGAREATRLDLATVDDPGCRQVLTRYERAGIVVAAWEMTSDVGLPAFQCAIGEAVEDPLHLLPVYWGGGCHPTREVALLRALTEAAQSRLTFIAGSRDDKGRRDYQRLGDPDTIRRTTAALRAGGPLRRYHDVPTFEGETFEADVAWELDRLRAVGVERVVMVDLTRPGCGLPVVRVVIPGLEAENGPGYVYGARAVALAMQQNSIFGGLAV
jgi:YcaO-like protein with predicted kinase domain